MAIDAVGRELVCGEVDALVTALAGERHRHVAGLEPEPQLEGLFRGHARAAHRGTVSDLEQAGASGLAARVAALRVERAQAEAEERWRAAESVAEGTARTVGCGSGRPSERCRESAIGSGG